MAAGVRIGVGSTMNYLGLILDSRLKIGEHFLLLAPKLERPVSRGCSQTWRIRAPPPGGSMRESCDLWPFMGHRCWLIYSGHTTLHI